MPDVGDETPARACTVSGGLADGQDMGRRRRGPASPVEGAVLTFPGARADGRVRVVTCTRMKTGEAP
ncbi:hypothetical protein [Streptomyces sp. OR43]|uniref:hypothetical protein n=1 Tax=Streptomyces sp. or43 TaxID=2478957 RepID=UPI0011CE57E9|nr:hypothetical protein [Streptomyces sp. or43]